MQDTTDPRNIEPRNIGETNLRSAERKSGLGGWLGIGLGIWSFVILVAVVFAS